MPVELPAYPCLVRGICPAFQVKVLPRRRQVTSTTALILTDHARGVDDANHAEWSARLPVTRTHYRQAAEHGVARFLADENLLVHRERRPGSAFSRRMSARMPSRRALRTTARVRPAHCSSR